MAPFFFVRYLNVPAGRTYQAADLAQRKRGGHLNSGPLLPGAGSPVARASILLFARYRALLAGAAEFHLAPEGCTRAHLLWMCETAVAQAPDWPDDKTSRWLGFVQGVMTMQGVLTVAGEREFSRPLFHAAYAEEGRVAPASVGRTLEM